MNLTDLTRATIASPSINFMLATTDASQPSEALTREQALKAYTSGGAHAGARKGDRVASQRAWRPI